jgi:transcriptional antiterminator NusG
MSEQDINAKDIAVDDDHAADNTEGIVVDDAVPAVDTDNTPDSDIEEEGEDDVSASELDDEDEGEEEVVALAVDEEDVSDSELDDDASASDIEDEVEDDVSVSELDDEDEGEVEDEVSDAELEDEDDASDVDGDDEDGEEEEEKEDEEPPRPDGTEWYVIHSYSGYENKVQKNLQHRIESMGMQDQIFQIVVPTEEEVELRDGQRRTIERRVFPGYILVEMLLNEDSWYVVRNTPGVTGFVGSGNNPTALRQEEVDNILKRMDAEAPKIKVSFKIGQKVRIVEGPFEDFMGTVDEIDFDRTRVRVLVNFFGRETPIELDFLQVERA